MKYKLIFSDFDGTLLRNDFTVGERSVAAIKDYIRRGGNFVVCTGRMAMSIGDEWRRFLGIDGERIPVVGFQGALVVDRDGKPLCCDYLTHDVVRRIVLEGKRLGVYVHYYDEGHVYVEEYNDINREYGRITGSPIEPVGDLLKFLDGHPSLGVMKAMAVCEPEQAAGIKAAYDELRLPGTIDFFSSDTYLEFVSDRGGKGRGLRKVAELLGVPLSETIAVGDNMNDIPMIEEAGLGVAVANAREAVKAVADYVTLDNDSDPIADIIERFCEDRI